MNFAPAFINSAENIILFSIDLPSKNIHFAKSVFIFPSAESYYPISFMLVLGKAVLLWILLSKKGKGEQIGLTDGRGGFTGV
jgi:hypothetical protein